jgi:hypothetical protein
VGATSSGWVLSFLGVPQNTELKNGEKCDKNQKEVQAVSYVSSRRQNGFEYPKKTKPCELVLEQYCYTANVTTLFSVHLFLLPPASAPSTTTIIMLFPTRHIIYFSIPFCGSVPYFYSLRPCLITHAAAAAPPHAAGQSTG